MTRTLEVVNLSNWDGEDYEVVILDHAGNPQKRVIKPGESMTVLNAHESGGILYKPVQRRDPETHDAIDTPFYEDGKQVFPHMDLSFK